MGPILASALIASQGGITGEPTVHLVFRVDENQLRAAYATGKDASRKKLRWDRFADPFIIDIGKVRAPTNSLWQAPWATLVVPAVAVAGQGYNDAREYKDSEDF